MSTAQQPSVTTFLFTDVVGSTQLTDSLGDEGAQDIMRAHNALVRAEVARHGGSEVKAMGDGFMIAFRSVSSALACAVAIQQAVEQHNLDLPTREFMVRMGLNAGEAIHEEADFFGAAVIVASRIAALADGGEIFTSAAVKQLAQGMRGVEYQFKGEYTLKGLREPYQIYEVLSGPAARPGQALIRRSRFVGREKEMEELKRLVEGAFSGTGKFALVTGEPGIGKSRLVEEAVRHARGRGLRVLRGRCYETEGAPPYVPFAEILREYMLDRPDDVLLDELGDGAGDIAKLVPELGQRISLPQEPGRMPPEQERYRLLEAVRSWLENLARRRPVLLFIEDLHWAGPATCLLLRHLASTVATAPVTILGTCREERPEPSSALGAALAEFARLQAYRLIALRGLTPDSLTELLATLGKGDPPAALVDALFGQTDGNPFFTAELINHLDAEGMLLSPSGDWLLTLAREGWTIPETVRAVIQRRLAALSEETRRVLAIASVLDKGFSYDLLETLEEVPSESLLDGLDEALRMGMIEEVEGLAAQFRFAHQLTQQTLYDDISALRRQRLHLHVGEAMEQLSQRVPSELAYHFTRAGRTAPPDKTAGYLVLAGHEAARAAAWEGAAAHYQRALELMPGDDGRERAELLQRLGEAQAGSGDWEGAVTSWREAMDTYERLGDGEAAGWIGYFLRRLHGARGQFNEASEIVQRALALPGIEDTEVRSRLLSQAGFIKSAFGEIDEAERLLDESMEIARKLENSAAQGFAAFIHGMHRLSYCRLAEAASDLESAASSSLAGKDLWAASQATSFRRHILFALGDLSGAADSMEEEERLARKAGNFLAVCETKWISSGVACLRGDLRMAEAFANELLALIEASQAESGLPGALINLAYIRFLAGDWASYQELLKQASDVYERMSAAPIDDPRPVLVLLHALTGQADEARKLLPDLERYFNFEDQWTTSLGEARITSGAALAVLGEGDSASLLYQPINEWAKSSGYVLTGASSIPQLVSRVLGMLASVTGAKSEAAAHFEVAIGEARAKDAATELAETCYCYARHLFQCGAPAEKQLALDMLSEASGIWQRSGMDKQVERALELEAATQSA